MAGKQKRIGEQRLDLLARPKAKAVRMNALQGCRHDPKESLKPV